MPIVVAVRGGGDPVISRRFFLASTGAAVLTRMTAAQPTKVWRTALAEELVHLKVDVIVAPTTPVARAAKGATTSIPIVFTIVSDPVGSGLVTSLSHPGGNITGMSDMEVDMAGKRLDLLKQVVPRLKRVGALGPGG